jgi:hypothetical protein
MTPQTPRGNPARTARDVRSTFVHIGWPNTATTDSCRMSTVNAQKVSALNPHLLRHNGAAARHSVYHTDVRLAAPLLYDAKDQIRMNPGNGEPRSRDSSVGILAR